MNNFKAKRQAIKIRRLMSDECHYDLNKRGKMLLAACKRLRSLNLDWKVNQMGVLKDPYKGLKKGDKVFNPAKGKDPSWKEVTKAGIRTRTILYYPKETRQAVRKCLIKALDMPAPWQHGFTHKQGIADAFKPTLNYQSLAAIDLESAFDQIEEKQVYWLFKKTYDLNHKDSEWLAHVMCHNGYVFQGNPVAPLIFNLLSSTIGWRLTKAGIKITQYADDLMILSPYPYLGWRFLRFICGVIEDEGWKVNPKKTKKFRKHKFKFLGVTHSTRNGTHVTGVRKLKKKTKCFQNMVEKIYHNDRDLIKADEFKTHLGCGIYALYRGYKGWLEYPREKILKMKNGRT